MTPEQKAVAAANLAKARAAKTAKLAAMSPEERDAARKSQVAPKAKAAPAPATDLASVLKALAGMSPQERAAIAAVLAPAQAAAPTPAVRPPAGVNLYAIMSLDAALKEALFELGATDRKVNAVPTMRLAAFLVERGLPKKGGRTYEGDEHALEVAIDLRLIADQALRLGKASPMRGWFHFIGGRAAGSPDNYEWSIPDSALADALTAGRTVTPAQRAPDAPPPSSGTPLRPALADGAAAYAEDMLPGRRSADQIMASLPKAEYAVGR